MKVRVYSAIFIFFIQITFLLAGEYPAPPTDWSIESSNVQSIVGLRPFREGGIRLEKETRDGVIFVHNYGHGGAGLTLSWGTVEHALRLVKRDLKNAKNIVVVGGGVIGFTTAYRLQELGYKVTLYSEEFYPNNVSNIAGGLWSPVSVDMTGNGSLNSAIMQRIQIESYEVFRNYFSQGWPVYEVPFFITEEAREKSGLNLFERLPNLFQIVRHPKIPIEGVSQAGFELKTFLIDTPRYMQDLSNRVRSMGRIETIQQRFNSLSEIAELAGSDAIVFNCSGLGAKTLAQDSHMIPVRGDLVLVKKTAHFSPRDFRYMTFYGNEGTDYAFFREGEVVVGGTFLKGVDSTEPNREVCAQKLESFARFFGR